MKARSILLLAVLLFCGLAATACGSSSSTGKTVTVTTGASTTTHATNAAAQTTPPASTQDDSTTSRTQLVSCLNQSSTPVSHTTEVGFAPPGGPMLVGHDGDADTLIVGVYPDTSYAKAQANTVAQIAAAYVGKPTATKNVHVVGNVVWFPQHSPFTGQHLATLDHCLTS